jgi:hypothetical protein
MQRFIHPMAPDARKNFAFRSDPNAWEEPQQFGDSVPSRIV